jgi:hypothetical protein
MEGTAACCADLGDPRTGNATRQAMLETLVTLPCPALTGGEGSAGMAEFAWTGIYFPCDFPERRHDAPSHSLFSRLFRLLAPEPFRTCFQDEWPQQPPCRVSTASAPLSPCYSAAIATPATTISASVSENIGARPRSA